MTEDEKRAARRAALRIRDLLAQDATMPVDIESVVDSIIEREFPPVVRIVPNVQRVDNVMIPGYPQGPYEFAVFDRVPHWRIMMRNGNPSTEWSVFSVSVHLLPPQVLAAVAEALTKPNKEEPVDDDVD